MMCGIGRDQVTLMQEIEMDMEDEHTVMKHL